MYVHVHAQGGVLKAATAQAVRRAEAAGCRGDVWQVRMSEDREGQGVRGEWRSLPRGASSIFTRSWVFSRSDTGSPSAEYPAEG